MTQAPNPQGASIKAHDLAKLRIYLQQQVHSHVEGNPPPPTQRKQVVEQLLEETFAQTKVLLPHNMKAQLFRDILDELLGYGPIQPLLDNPEITEVMVNGPHRVYIEKNGKIERTGIAFQNDNHLLRVIERIVLPLGRRIDQDNPTVDARLPDGSRVNAVIPPVAIDGPSMTIRKFPHERLGINELISLDSITATMAQFLEACVKARLNIVISGGTGSGKTTLLNVLSGYIPDEERIVTIEDAAELRLHQEHIVRMETKSPDLDGKGGVSVRDLVRNSLRMRPDRIVVGEVRGGEALDMLQAMNTGHDGSLTTLHANSPRDAIARLETLVLMSGVELPSRSIREQIASAIDVIVQQTRLTDGSRKVTHITEVAGMEGDTVVMTDIFEFSQTGVSPDGSVIGRLIPTGIRPLFMGQLERSGFRLGAEVFMKTRPELGQIEANQLRPRR